MELTARMSKQSTCFVIPILLLIKDVASDEWCYNYDEDEWHSCAAGCCGSGDYVQCCVDDFIVGLIILGVILCIIIAVVVGIWIYKKKTITRRIVNPNCPSDGANCNVSVVQNSNIQWPYASQPLQPPPYTAASAPPPYTFSQQENIGHSLQLNDQQTQSNNSELGSYFQPTHLGTQEESQHSIQQRMQASQERNHVAPGQDLTGQSTVVLSHAPPLYTLREAPPTNDRTIRSEPPPQYGVYPDLVRTPPAHHL